MSLGEVRPRLMAVWGLLFVLVAGIVLMQRSSLDQTRPVEDDGHGHSSGGRPLLPVPLEQIGAIELAHSGVMHRFERDAAGMWFYHGVHGAAQATHEHRPDPATAEHIGRALSMFARTRIERQFTLDPGAFGRTEAERPLARDPVRDYGVTTPSVLVLVYAPNTSQPLARYAVGDVAPDNLGRYLHVLGTSVVVTIAKYQIDNLLQLVAEMSSRPAAGQPEPANQTAK